MSSKLPLEARIASIEDNEKDWRQAATISGNSMDLGPSRGSMNIDATIVFGVDENYGSDQLPEKTVAVLFDDCRGDEDQEISLITSSLNRRPSIDGLITTPLEAADSAHINYLYVTGTNQSAENLFEGLRSQYLEALYISKVCMSLANP